MGKKIVMKILISGTNSGLGKYLHKQFNSDCFVRGDSLPLETRYDAIIHCAVSTDKDIKHSNIKKYISDNVFLTEKLCSVPCDKFIYISTVDVYPDRGQHFWTESDEIVVSVGFSELSLYGITKFISEATVMKTPNWLILRCSSLLNDCSRKNSIMKSLDADCHDDAFIHGSSKICCVLVSDIANFISMAVLEDLNGTYNVASSDRITMSQMAELSGSGVEFGEHEYIQGRASNVKICEKAPYFNKTSQDVVEQFLDR